MNKLDHRINGVLLSERLMNLLESYQSANNLSRGAVVRQALEKFFSANVSQTNTSDSINQIKEKQN